MSAVGRAIKTHLEPMSSHNYLFINQKVVWARIINFCTAHLNKILENGAEWLAATNIHFIPWALFDREHTGNYAWVEPVFVNIMQQCGWNYKVLL